MAVTLNFQVLVDAYLRKARAEASARVYLLALHNTALAAVNAGDEFVTSTSGDGGSGTSERAVPAVTLLQILEACLKVLDAEDAAAAAAVSAPTAGARYADFSSYPCILG